MSKREVSPEEIDAMLTQDEASAPDTTSSPISEAPVQDLGPYDNIVGKGLAMAEQFAAGAVPFYDTATTHLSTLVESGLDAVTGMGEGKTYSQKYAENLNMRRRYAQKAKDATGLAGSAASLAGTISGLAVGGGAGLALKGTATGAKALQAAKAAKGMKSLQAGTQAALQGASKIRGGATLAKYGPGVAKDAAFFTGHDLDDMILNDQEITGSTIVKALGKNAAISMVTAGGLGLAGKGFKSWAKGRKIKIEKESADYAKKMVKDYFGGSEKSLKSFMDDVGISTVTELRSFFKRHGMEKLSTYADTSKLKTVFQDARVAADGELGRVLSLVDDVVDGGLVSSSYLINQMDDIFKAIAPQMSKGVKKQAEALMKELVETSGTKAIKLQDVLKLRNSLLAGDVKHGAFSKQAIDILETTIQRGLKNANQLGKLAGTPAKANKFLKPLQDTVAAATKRVDKMRGKVDDLVDKYTNLMKKGEDPTGSVARRLEQQIQTWGKRLDGYEKGLGKAEDALADGMTKLGIGTKVLESQSAIKNLPKALKESAILARFTPVVKKLSQPQTIDGSVGGALKETFKTLLSKGGSMRGGMIGATSWALTGSPLPGMLLYAGGTFGKNAFKNFANRAVAKIAADRNIAIPLAERLYRRKVSAGLTRMGKVFENQAQYGAKGRNLMQSFTQVMFNPEIPDEVVAETVATAGARVDALEEPFKLETAQFLDPQSAVKREQLLDILGAPDDVDGDENLAKGFQEVFEQTGPAKTNGLRQLIDTLRKDSRYSQYFEQGQTIDGKVMDPQEIQAIADKAFTDNIQIPYLVRRQVVDQFIQSGDLVMFQQALQEMGRQPMQYVPKDKFVF